MGSISEEETCEKLKGLIQRQVQMCKRNLEVMDSVRRGAQLAIEECQYQFRNRRWNCSTLDSLPVFGKVVTQGEGGTHRGAGGGGCGARVWALDLWPPEETTVSLGGESMLVSDRTIGSFIKNGIPIQRGHKAAGGDAGRGVGSRWAGVRGGRAVRRGCCPLCYAASAVLELPARVREEESEAQTGERMEMPRPLRG